jgi:hypothetical protein
LLLFWTGTLMRFATGFCVAFCKDAAELVPYPRPGRQPALVRSGRLALLSNHAIARNHSRGQKQSARSDNASYHRYRPLIGFESQRSAELSLHLGFHDFSRLKASRAEPVFAGLVRHEGSAGIPEPQLSLAPVAIRKPDGFVFFGVTRRFSYLNL